MDTSTGDKVMDKLSALRRAVAYGHAFSCALCMLLLASCRDQTSQSAQSASQETGAATTSQSQSSTASKSVTLQSANGAPLGIVAFGGTTPDGYYSVDISLGRVTTYDSAGSAVARYGRMGGGPDEFRMIGSSAISQNRKEIAILDAGASSSSLLSLGSPIQKTGSIKTPGAVATVSYCCSDSLLVFAPYVTANASDSRFQLYDRNGVARGSFGLWTKWSEEMMPSYSGFAINADDSYLVAAELFGKRLAMYRIGEMKPEWEAELETIATPMTAHAVEARKRKIGNELTLGWWIPSVWIVGRDSVLVMTDSLDNNGQDHVRRYSLVTPTHQTAGSIIKDHVLEIRGDTAILGDHDDDGNYQVTRLPWRSLLEKQNQR